MSSRCCDVQQYVVFSVFCLFIRLIVYVCVDLHQTLQTTDNVDEKNIHRIYRTLCLVRTRCAYLIRFSLPMNVRQISRYAGKENKRKPQRNKVCIVTTKRISIGKTHFINKQLKYTNISVFLVYLLVPLLVLICSLMCCVCVCFFHSF